MLYLTPELNTLFPANRQGFKQIMALQGEIYRALEGRRTQRITLQKTAYFIKQHYGVGWREIIKNVCQGRWPILSARWEWRALNRMQKIGMPVPSLVGFGCSGWNPARLHSFVMTEALPPHVSLEEYCRPWQKEPPAFREKQRLIQTVARMTRTMHQHGVNHRDLYICHFLLDLSLKEQGQLYLIDWHRAQIRRAVPERWLIKDLAGLYFSSKDIGLTRRDLLRFVKEYRNKPLRDCIYQERVFWQRIANRGDKLYRKHAKS